MKDDLPLAIWTCGLCLAGVLATAMWVFFEMWR